jgi:hypothetical protein
MNRWRVGDDRGSKEMDGCPLTGWGRGKLTMFGSRLLQSSQTIGPRSRWL